MRVAVLGAGAMGMLVGGLLSRKHNVILIDTDEKRVESIQNEGIRILEPDEIVNCYHPEASVSSEGMEPVDLLIVFVKAMYSHGALYQNTALIGPSTYVMTLQNGSGHEKILREFAEEDRIIIGTTQHNSSIEKDGVIRHGGGGKTVIGSLTGAVENLEPLAEAFTECGLETETSEHVQHLIWKKLFLNTSASALTGVLHVPLGYLVDNPHAWKMTEALAREAVAVAVSEGLLFDPDAVVADIRYTLEHSRGGITSICADLANGRKTEVDTISGFVVQTSRRNKVPAPGHEMMVELIHAIEGRSKIEDIV